MRVVQAVTIVRVCSVTVCKIEADSITSVAVQLWMIAATLNNLHFEDSLHLNLRSA